jgi:predicted AAA+ superfamily ATPase
MIDRVLQTEIAALMKQFPAVAILGARQVGKTTLAKSIAASQKRPVLYLDLENPIDVKKLDDPFSFLNENKDKCILIDEVQTIPRLFSVLRSIIDADRRNGRFILLGSASPTLVKGVSESLAGRIAYRELSPVGLMELPEKISIEKHWFRGGFPLSLLARSEVQAHEWLDSFIRSYIERDLGSLFGVELTSGIIRRMLSMLAHLHGNVWNAEMLARSLGLSAPTVNRYADFFEGAFLLHKLPPFFINTRKRLVKSPKVYLRDSGLLHRVAGISGLTNLKGHPLVGASWEGYVLEQIRQAKKQQHDLYYYRTQAGAEYDVVIADGIHPKAAVEIKLNNAPVMSKGNMQSIVDLGTKKNFVITPSVEEYKNKDGIIITGLRTFIDKHLPKI